MEVDTLYKKLDYIGKDNFIILSDSPQMDNIQLPDRVLRIIRNQQSPISKASAILTFGGKPMVLIFDRPQDKQGLFKAIWNLNEVPIVVVNDFDQINVYNGFAYEKQLESLQIIGDSHTLDTFSYFKLVTGQSWETYRSQLAYHNRVDYYLLKNIQFAQDKIQSFSVSRNLTNRLIGKIIFLRYLTDRKVMLDFEGNTRVLTNDDIIDLLCNRERLIALFEILQDGAKGFNGDLFKITKAEIESIPEGAFQVLVHLLRSDNLEDGSLSLFDVYDFSILPVEFISNVYERFIGKENQQKSGAYYTPLFLVNYIVENTVAIHLNNQSRSSCKVLDPACGSGIFLVESLRRIIDHYIRNEGCRDFNGPLFQEKLRKLTIDNIFGIDSDESAIQVAIFSIYLTLLDYLKPADITTFQFPSLMGTNLICQDAFLGLPFSDVNFDFIIGNPPWNRGRKVKDTFGNVVKPEYQIYIEQKTQHAHKHKIIGNKEIAQAFVIRTFDYMRPNTKVAFVLTSKVLYNVQSKPFRSYLLEKAYIDTVMEFSSVRREVFSQSSDPSIAPACVIFYRQKNNNKDVEHVMTHVSVKQSVFFSLFKILTVEKPDLQKVRQVLLQQYDYLWKILLYGSYLDFNLIKRLQNKKSIKDVMDENKFLYGLGVTCGKEENRRYDISEYVGKRKVRPGNLIQYFIIPSDETWQVKTAQWGRRIQLFQAPLLLVRKSIDSTNYSCRAAISNDDVVYTDAITGVCGNNINVLRNIVGTLNSKFFSYYALMCLSSIATEREQAHNDEKFSMPYVDAKIYTIVEDIEKIYNHYISSTSLLRSHEIQDQIDKKRELIESCIATELGLSSEELALVDYANTYSIPMAAGRPPVTQVLFNSHRNDVLKQYITVFQERFDGQFGEDTFLNCSCAVASTHVMLRFTVSKEKKKIEWKEDAYGALDAFLMSLSTEAISEQLFLRKDIRGFEKDGFYVVKPAEARLWHPAVAYIDVQEFVDALLSNM